VEQRDQDVTGMRVSRARFLMRHALYLGSVEIYRGMKRLTASARALPTVYLLGAPRSGTTTLTSMLWGHPAHVRPVLKEAHYLHQLPGFISNRQLSSFVAVLSGRPSMQPVSYSANGYRQFFPMRRQIEQQRIRQGMAFTSDCDPFNLYCPIAMRRIIELGHEPKFIVLLRNPVDRAYSDYRMHVSRAGERRTFEVAIEEEMAGSVAAFRKRFLYQSLYAPHVERWLAAIPNHRLLFICAEDLFQDGAGVAATVFSFLGLPHAPVRAIQLNAGMNREPLCAQTRDRLNEYFASANQHLAALLQRDFPW
jgi:Sulfotransferase family